jgi:branched-chain amino acid transport system permease protein
MDIVIHAALISGLYALIAAGFTMVYSVGRVLNLAYGTYIMLSGYVYFQVVQQLGFPPVVGFIVAIGAGVGLALATYTGIARRFLHDPTAVFVATLIVAILFQSLIVIGYGDLPRNVLPVVSGTFLLFGITVSKNTLAAMILSWVILGGLLVFVTKTHLGRAIRATSMDMKGALISGVNPETIRLVTWGWSGALAGVAGVFFGTFSSLTPYMWVFPLVISFAIVIIGGVGSIPGAVLAAYIIGFAETTTTMMIDARLSGAVAFAVMIAIIVLRPRGFFGREI